MIAAGTEPADGGLRARKKAEARAAIVDGALALFARHGYDAVTVDQIAERAGVARRTYFRYFATKEAVALDRRHRQLAMFRDQLTTAPRELTPVEVLDRALRALAADYRADRRRILAERALFAGSGELIAADLQVDRALELAIVDMATRRAGAGAAPVRAARMFAAAAMGVARVMVEEWADSDGALDMIALGAPALAVIAVLAPPAARRGGRRRPGASS
ncbi:MAG: TetR family transcriptional regulator [Myxococcales bacterium]|nr:TetR family transcriptional regulator [Myxococcales bacterium]